MNCCTNCFNDKEIIGFIFSNSTEKGDCDFCDGKDLQLIDARELEELFQPIIALFKKISELGITVIEEKLIHQKVQETWKIFKIADDIVLKALFASIVSDSLPADAPLLNSPVEIE